MTFMMIIILQFLNPSIIKNVVGNGTSLHSFVNVPRICELYEISVNVNLFLRIVQTSTFLTYHTLTSKIDRALSVLRKK